MSSETDALIAIASSSVALIPIFYKPAHMSSADTEPLDDLSHWAKMRSTFERDAYLRRSAFRMSLTAIRSTHEASDWVLV